MGHGLELALEELVDDTLAVDLEGLGEGVEVEGAGEGVSQTERKHERDPAAGILERPAPALTKPPSVSRSSEPSSNDDSRSVNVVSVKVCCYDRVVIIWLVIDV